MQAPSGMSTVEFVVVASLRAAQLSRGCTPKVEGEHKRIVIAQMEVAQRKIVRIADVIVGEA